MAQDPFLSAVYAALKDRPYGKQLARLLNRQLPKDWEYRFELTETHVKLLRRLVVYYRYESHLGAPAVSLSRPYGNSVILSDVAGIVGIPEPDWENGENWTEERLTELLKWHYETTRALEVFLCAATIEPGVYVRHYAFDSWKLKEDNA